MLKKLRIETKRNTDAISQINNTIKEQKEYFLERMNAKELK